MQVTPQGLEKLKQELHHLKTVKRKELAERLKKAISYGDLSENAEYKEAKEAQGFLEGRILELSRLIAKAKVIAIKKDKDGKIGLGSIVTLKPEKGGAIKLTLVGAGESDVSQNKISVESPLGGALLAKKAGQKISLQTAEGKKTFEIVTVS